MQKHISTERLMELIWLALKLSVVVIFVLFCFFVISCKSAPNSIANDAGIDGSVDGSVDANLPDKEDSGQVGDSGSETSRSGRNEQLRLPSLTRIGILPSF